VNGCELRSQDYDSCLKIDDLSGCMAADGYRLDLFIASIYFPLVVFLIELGINRIEMSGKHVLYPTLVNCFYLICTAFDQYV
jgi:hypothetical protein